MAASSPSGTATARAITAISTVPQMSAQTPNCLSAKSGDQVVEPKKSPKGMMRKNSTVSKIRTSTMPSVTKAESAAVRKRPAWMKRPEMVSRPVPPRLGWSRSRQSSASRLRTVSRCCGA